MGGESAEEQGSVSTRRPAPAVSRAGRILAALADSGGSLSVTELATRVALPKSSTLAICTALVESGLARRSATGTYELGALVLRLSHAYLSRTDVRLEFERICSELNPLPAETLVLSMLDGRNVLYLAERRGSRPLGLRHQVGMRLPATCTASGKAALSTLPDARVKEIFPDDAALSSLTGASISTVDRLMGELAATRERGYAIDDEETVQGMLCVGVAIPGCRASGPAAMAVSMVKSTVATSTLQVIVATLQRASEALSLPLASLTDLPTDGSVARDGLPA
ncbi:MAG: IclR family transcriptional regulator [Acidimicrobiales bacterium]